jgi:hypothetical protein
MKKESYIWKEILQNINEKRFASNTRMNIHGHTKIFCITKFATLWKMDKKSLALTPWHIHNFINSPSTRPQHPGMTPQNVPIPAQYLGWPGHHNSIQGA